MKTYLLILIAILITSNCEILKNLNEESYLNFSDKNDEYLLILCKNGKEMQNFEKLHPEVPTLLFDITKQQYIAKLYTSTAYPHTQYIISEKAYTYHGPITNQKINLFINRIKTTNIEEILTLEELKDSMKKNNLRYTILLAGKYDKIIDLNVLAHVCKGVSINIIYHSSNQNLVESLHLSKYEFELFLLTDTLEQKRLYVQTLDKYDEYELTKFINLMVRNIYGDIRLLDLSLALSGKPIPTLFFIYGSNVTEAMHNDMRMIAEEYISEFNVVHGNYKNKYMTYISKFFKLTEQDLPALVLTKPDKYNDDDVEKYLLKLGPEFKREVILSLINDPTQRVYLSEPDEYVKMIGENLVEVLSEPIKEGHDILLLICPLESKKHHRIRKRLEIVFKKMYKQNNETVLVDEIDGLLNDIPDVSYTDIPSVVLLSPSETEKKWKHVNYHGDFTTESMIEFVKNNSKRQLVSDPVESEINAEESKMPITTVSKYSYEKNRFEEAKNIFTFGLKRMWKILKFKNKVKMVNYLYDDLFESGEEDFDEVDAADIEIITPNSEL